MAKTKSPDLCSKDGCENPRAQPGSTMPWCKEHRAEYLKAYEKTQEWRDERRGIVRGIQAMREEIARYFRQWGGARPFQGPEVASIVEGLPGPAVADESAKPQTP